MQMMNYNKEIILKGDNLSVSFNSFGSQVKVFHNLKLPEIYRGDLVFLIGSNGVGKSTLFNILIGTIHDYFGTILLKGEKIETYSKKELASIIYLINQNPISCTIDELTVRENLIYSINKKKSATFTSQLAEINLQNHKTHLVKNLSGGQRQLLALQIAKLRRTELLLMDEPFAALDPRNVAFATNLLKDLLAMNTTVFFITHDLEFIENVDVARKRIFLLENGTVIEK